MTAQILRLGSLVAQLEAPDALGADIARLFGTSLKCPTDDLVQRLDAVITAMPANADTVKPVADKPDGMTVQRNSLQATIQTEVLFVTIDRGRLPVQIQLFVRRSDITHYELRVHLAVVMHKVLFLLDRVVLHAAAVRIGGHVAVFVGDRGAGKTTTALALSRAGGIVLSEDHLILKRSADGFLVSGCDERWRVDARTERHFFDGPLPVEASDFAGRMKKEVAVRTTESRPFADERATQLFFIRPGSRFQIAPLSRGVTVLKLMEEAGKLQRFVDADDRQQFLSMLSDFSRTITPWALERSDDLGDLDQLIAFLRTNIPTART